MECPWKGGVQLSLGEGPSKVGPMSQPRGTINTVSRTLIRTNARVRFPNQLYSRQLRVTIYRGAVSHRARVVSVSWTMKFKKTKKAGRIF